MRVIRTPYEKVRNYYDRTEISQSYLKNMDKDPRLINEPFSQSNADHFVLGQIVDIKLTGEEGDFEKEFFILELEKLPSDAVQNIAKSVLELIKQDYEEYLQVVAKDLEVQAHIVGETEEEVYREGGELIIPESFISFAGTFEERRPYFLSVAREVGWNARYGDEAILTNLKKEGEEYFNILIQAEGKRAISRTMYNTAMSVINSLVSHPRTSFAVSPIYLSEKIDVYFQLICFFEYRGINFKMMADKVTVVRDDEGNIEKVIGEDIKTMSGNTLDFPQSVRAFRYDIQAAFYRKGLAMYFGIPEEKVFFYFIVESTTLPGKPLIFQVTEDLFRVGKEGATFGTKVIKGYEQHISDYQFYLENGFTEEPLIKQAGGFPLLISGDYTAILPDSLTASKTQENGNREW